MPNSFCCNFVWNDIISSSETRSREQNVQQGEGEEVGLAVDLVEEEEVEEEKVVEEEVVAKAGSWLLPWWRKREEAEVRRGKERYWDNPERLFF